MFCKENQSYIFIDIVYFEKIHLTDLLARFNLSIVSQARKKLIFKKHENRHVAYNRKKHHFCIFQFGPRFEQKTFWNEITLCWKWKWFCLCENWKETFYTKTGCVFVLVETLYSLLKFIFLIFFPFKLQFLKCCKLLLALLFYNGLIFKHHVIYRTIWKICWTQWQFHQCISFRF